MSYHYYEPEKPTPGTKRFKVTRLLGTSQRWNHFENDEYRDDPDFMEDSPENTGKPRYGQSLSLKEINDAIKLQGLKEDDVHFTVSFSDDYVCLEAIHIKEMNEQEQLEEYKVFHEEWQSQEDKKVNKLLKTMKRR